MFAHRPRVRKSHEVHLSAAAERRLWVEAESGEYGLRGHWRWSLLPLQALALCADEASVAQHTERTGYALEPCWQVETYVASAGGRTSEAVCFAKVVLL